MRIYKKFEEVEFEIFEQTPPIIYKFRNWENPFHRDIICKRILWFAHPYELNDPFEARPPINFICDKLDIELVRKKMMAAGMALYPNSSKDELENEVNIRIQDFVKNPVDYFKRNRDIFNSDSINFDNYGIFSCCQSFDNEPMWAHYGNNHSGFAVGFKTVELARELRCGVGFVNYNDSPIDYYIFGNNEDIAFEQIYRKSTKWSIEQEIRFVISGIGFNRERANFYSTVAVEEIIFGIKTSNEIQVSIIEEAYKILPNVNFYKLQLNSDTFGFNKIKIV